MGEQGDASEPIALNFRPVRGTKLYRSSMLDNISEAGLEKLKEELGIRSIFDMRKSKQAGRIDQCYRPTEASRETNGSVKLLDLTCQLAKENLADKGTEMSEKSTEIVEVEQENPDTMKLVGNHFYFDVMKDGNLNRVLMSRVPWKDKLKLVYLLPKDWAMKTTKGIQLIMTHAVVPGGPVQLYKDLLDYCSREICTALEVLSRPEYHPGVICCMVGKDRTGMICALCQEVCGVDRQVIIEDYAMSKTCLGEPVPHHIVAELQDHGMSPDFEDSKAEWMREVLEYIDTKYTSTQEYLKAKGFNLEKQKMLKDTICI